MSLPRLVVPILGFLYAFTSLTICRADIVVDFGPGNFQFLPYSEDGFTFTNFGGTGFISGSPDGRLSLSNPGVPLVKTRITGTSNFDLLAFDVVFTQVGRDWRLQSSSGGIFSLPNGTAAGTQTLTGPGWNNLTFVDIIHDTNQANAQIFLDNFHFIMPSSAPEPHILFAIPLIGLAAFWRRRVIAARKRSL